MNLYFDSFIHPQNTLWSFSSFHFLLPFPSPPTLPIKSTSYFQTRNESDSSFVSMAIPSGQQHLISFPPLLSKFSKRLLEKQIGFEVEKKPVFMSVLQESSLSPVMSQGSENVSLMIFRVL